MPALDGGGPSEGPVMTEGSAGELHQTGDSGEDRRRHVPGSRAAAARAEHTEPSGCGAMRWGGATGHAPHGLRSLVCQRVPSVRAWRARPEPGLFGGGGSGVWVLPGGQGLGGMRRGGGQSGQGRRGSPGAGGCRSGPPGGVWGVGDVARRPRRGHREDGLRVTLAAPAPHPVSHRPREADGAGSVPAPEPGPHPPCPSSSFPDLGADFPASLQHRSQK